MQGVLFTPLRRIPTAGGDVRHALQAGAPGYAGFGEAYFSSVDAGAVKGWKRHRRMTLNLIVPVGAVRFVVIEEGGGGRVEHLLSPEAPESYGRLTVTPGLWMAFGGVGPGLNLVLNVADIEHDPDEAESRGLEAFAWSQK